VFLAVVGLLAGGVLAWATSESGSQFISEKLRESVKREYGVDITFRDIDIEFFPPRLRLQEITATDGKGRVGCTIEEAEVAPDALDLIRGELTVEEVYLGSPRCTVTLDEAAIDELLVSLKREPKTGFKQGIDLSVIPKFEVFAVSDGDLDATIEDPDRIGRLQATVTGLGLDITGGTRSIEVRGLIDRAQGTWQKGDQSIDEGLSGFAFRAAVTPHAVDVRHLDADIAGTEIRARDAHVPIPIWPRGPDVADLSVQVPLEMLRRLPLDLPLMWGSAGFLGQASVRREQDGTTGLSARGRIELGGVKVDEFVIGDLEGLVSVSPRGVAFAEVDIATAEGRLRLDGNVAFDEDLTTDVTARLDRIELAHLLENLTLDGAQVTQRMTGTARAKGQLKPLRLDGTVKLEVIGHTVLDDGFRTRTKKTVLHVPRSNVQSRFRVTDKSFSLIDTEVRLPNSRLGLDARFHFDTRKGWNMLIRSDRMDLGDLKKIAGLEVDGLGRLTCKINDRTYGTPQIIASASFRDMELSGYNFGAISTGIRFRGLNLVFDGLTVRGEQSRYSAGEVRLEFGGRAGLKVETKIDAEHVAIEEIMRTFKIDPEPWGDPTGMLYGRVAVEYSMHPDHFRIDGDLGHERMTIFGERFGRDVLRFTWNDGLLLLNELGLAKGRGMVSITGAVLPDNTLDFIGLASDIELSSIDNPQLRKLGLSGSGQLFLRIEGKLDHPKGWGDLRLGEMLHRGVRYGPTHLELEVDDAVITGHGQVGGKQLSLEHGLIDLKRERFEVEAFVHDLNVIDLFDFDTEGHHVALSATGDVSLSGRLAARPRLTGTAEFESVEFAIDDFEFENKGPLRIVAKRDRFRVRRTRFSGPRLVFDLSGRAGLEKIDLKIRGLADLRSLSELTSTVADSSGKLTLDARATGTWTDPSFRGQATVEGGAVNIRGFPDRIKEISGQVDLGAKVIRFTDFTGTTAGGSLEVDGQLTLSGLDVADYRFRARAGGLKLSPIADLTFTASTVEDGLLLKPGKTINLPGGETRRLPTITGDVEITDLRYTHDLRMIAVSDLTVDRLTGTKTRMSRPRVLDEKKDKFAFDIRLHGARNLKARNNILDADLRIDDVEDPLRLVGTNQIFGFRGRVLATRGQLRFAGKRFELRYAAVSFRDPLRPDNPHFRVTADGQVRDWKVTITARGTVDEYEIGLSAQPSLSKEDVVFLLLTGMTRAEHRQFGSTGLSGIGAPLLDQIGPGGELIPLEVQIYSEYSERAGTDTTRVSLGQWVTDDVWIAISSSVGQERDIKANLDYKIADSLVIDGDSLSLSADYENDNESQIGNVGLDLKFRLEF
jgi:hypothetical protein